MDLSFRSQLTLAPRTDLSIADTSNIRHFLQEICIHFTLDNVLQFRLNFLRSLLFHFLARFMAFSGPWKCRDLQRFPVRIYLYGRRVFQLQKCPKSNGTGIEMWIQSWRSMLHMGNHFSFTVRIGTNQRNSILFHFVDRLFYALQTLANQWLPNYHISIISSNILSLGFFLLHTLGSITLYPNTIE